MAELQAVLDETKHGALDEALKGLYKQNSETNEFYLNLPEKEAVKLTFSQNAQLQKKEGLLKTLHEDKRAVETSLATFTGLGKTAEEIEAELASAQPEAINELIAKNKEDIRLNNESYATKIDGLEGTVQTQSKQISEMLVDNVISEVARVRELNDSAPYILRTFLKVVTDETTGEGSIQVVKDGSPFTIAGEPVTPNGLITHFAEEGLFPSMFKANGGGGSGGSNNQSGKVTNGTIANSDISAMNANLEDIALGKVRVT